MGETATSHLVLAAAQGDHEAWNTLVKNHSQLVWAVITTHRLRPADAGDVFQTTWLRLVENLTTLRQPDRLAAWLVTTARRECLRLLQARRRETLDTDLGEQAPDAWDDQLGPEAAVLDNEQKAAVARAFRRLPERCRLLLRLWLSDPPLEYGEIAQELGVPVGSVGPTRRRCLDHLGRLLADVSQDDRPDESPRGR